MPPHILIVDDEPQVAFFLHQALKSMKPDYVVSTVQTGAEALQLARREPLDLMIIDYRLKDMDGLSLAAALERLGCAPPVIMITAGPPPESGSHMDVEQLCWIQKPFSIAQLGFAIDEFLSDTRPFSNPGSCATTRKSFYPRDRNSPPPDPGDGKASGRECHPRDPNTASG